MMMSSVAFRSYCQDNISNGIGIRGGSRIAAASKMECFVIIVNGWKPLTIITKRSILDVAGVLDPPLSIFLLQYSFCGGIEHLYPIHLNIISFVQYLAYHFDTITYFSTISYSEASIGVLHKKMFGFLEAPVHQRFGKKNRSVNVWKLSTKHPCWSLF